MTKSTTTTCYVARDPDGAAYLFKEKPRRWNCENIEYWANGKSQYRVSQKTLDTQFPDLTWECEPIEVELTITRK